VSNLSDLMPAGASGKTIEAVATATITSKAPVGLNADGTVTVIGGSAPVPQTIPDGVAQAYNSSSMNISSIAFDPNTAGEFVIAFIESGVLKAVVGNLSGTTATFGTPVTVNAATTTISFSSAGYNPNVAKQFVIAFIDGTDSNKGKVALGTVASTVITMQSAVTYDAGSTGTEAPPSVAFDPNTSGNFVISYRDSTGHGAALVCSISGTTITANSPTNFTTGWAYGNLINSSCDPNTANKVVIVYQDGRGSDYGKSVVGTVSGTSISFGAINVFESAATQGPSVDYNPATANHFAIAYKGSGEDGKAILGTISGTTITYPDSPVIFATVNAISTNIAFDPNTDDEFVISYDESSNLYIVTGTASATTVALDTPIEIYPTAASYSTTRFNPDSDSAGQFMTSFQDGDAADFGTLRFGQIAATQPKSSADFVGIADAAITSDATFVVTVGGGKFVIDGVSQDTVSLQEGATYTFDQAAGTNSTHPLRFSTTSDGTHGGGSEYTTGVTTNGTPGSAGAYTRIVVADSAPTLYYYCSAHSGMGGTANTPAFSATGTIVVQGGTVTGLSLPSYFSSGTPVVFEAASASNISATFDSDSNKVVIAYTDVGNSNYGTAVVGTVSGDSISYGTPVVFETSSTSQISATFDSDSNKVVLSYRDNGNSDYGTSIVGTVSGTAISFGTAVLFNSAATYTTSATFDSDSNKVVISYRDGGASSYGTAIVGTVSGTAISFGTAVVFEAASCDWMSGTFDSDSNKVVIAYQDNGNSGYGTGIVGTVSGTSISFGTAVVFEAASSTNIRAIFDSDNNKVVVAYDDVGNSEYGTGVVGTVSGTAISFGTPVVFETAHADYVSAVFDSASNTAVISYQDRGNSSYGTVIQGTVSGTSISYGTAVVFEAASSSYIGSTFDSDSNKVVIAYSDAGNSAYGTAIVGAFTTSFVTGSKYYVQNDGTISTVSSSVNAGLAISTTSLLLNGDS
jgi:hypothetical protein